MPVFPVGLGFFIRGELHLTGPLIVPVTGQLKLILPVGYLELGLVGISQREGQRANALRIARGGEHQLMMPRLNFQRWRSQREFAGLHAIQHLGS